MSRRIIVDTDTAGDDVQALLLACLTDRLRLEAVTIVAGNVPFDRQVENAKYTLSLVGADDTPVYEGARGPLLKDFHHVEHIHGAGGLGGNLHPKTGIPSAEEFAPAEIVRRCRAAPGEYTLLCIGPLTNLALALSQEPALPELVDEVWMMGGAVHCEGNVTPAAEYNVWVDPDAAKRVFEAFEVTLVDWGLSLRDSLLRPDGVDAVQNLEGKLADVIGGIIAPVYEFTRTEQDVDGVPQPDSLTAALLAYPELRRETTTYAVEVDERSGLTRGYLSVDVNGGSGTSAQTRVVESADRAAFCDVVLGMLRDRDPDQRFRNREGK
ncbi:MAG: nucleoside hydrolase [Bacteroidetes bacterium SW_9_63_38]|nr:MAG: nucleoside hydrolase [Bacteroidetes bacterium SW_9_63_38]